MKRLFHCLLTLLLLAAGCNSNPDPQIIEINLSDTGVTVNGQSAEWNKSTSLLPAVYTANDILFYPTGKDFTYGEATADEMHEQEEADMHTVVHITAPGTYKLSGTLSKGQIAVDLGERAKNNPNATVTLVLDGVNLTCDVAPSILFYNVYECSSDEEDSATPTVDTAKAGANILIADGSENTVNGSYVARIYESYELNMDGTEVEDYDTLHKYDGAIYSKMSMNLSGGEIGDGVLHINAENEGLGTDLHLTINGGNININSGNDGINTNEDGVSVTTVNSGTVSITVNGTAGEGDGIDSNGWLVINGGTVHASACDKSIDSGIDSDLGIYLNGGIVLASGNMLDQIADSKATYAVFQFAEPQPSGMYTLKDANGNEVIKYTPPNGFTVMLLSSFDLKEGTYTLWQGETQLQGTVGKFGGKSSKDKQPPPHFDPSKTPNRGERSKDLSPKGGTLPHNAPDPEAFSREFALKNGENYFSFITK